VFATAAAGQAEPDVPHDGNWLATIQTADGSRQSARFVIRQFSGESGSAQEAGIRRRTAPAPARSCQSRCRRSTAEALEFTVWASQVSPKCPNLTIEVKSAGKDVFDGKVESVGTIRVTRR
jgi:hypothetical protein